MIVFVPKRRKEMTSWYYTLEYNFKSLQ